MPILCLASWLLIGTHAFAASCHLLLEPPPAERTARHATRIDAEIAPYLPNLINQMHFVVSAAAAKRVFDAWLRERRDGYGLAHGREAERRRRAESFARSFGVADGLIEELEDAFITLNQRGRRAPDLSQLGFLFGRLGDELMASIPTELAFGAAIQAGTEKWKGYDAGACARSIDHILDAYIRLRAEVETARQSLLTARPADDQPTYFDQRQILGAVSRLVRVHDAGSRDLYELVNARTEVLKTELNRHILPFDKGTEVVTQSLEALKRLVALAKSAAGG